MASVASSNQDGFDTRNLDRFLPADLGGWTKTSFSTNWTKQFLV